MTIPTADDERWMGAALEQARAAERAGDIPVGAIVVQLIHEGARQTYRAIARANNRTLRDQDPTAHAEVLAVRDAARTLGNWRLTGCTLYVTLEPCAMCAGAVVLSRLDRLVYGAFDDKAGMVGSIADLVRHPKLNHRAEVLGGVRAEECGELLRTFFQARRNSVE
jgi:tRNA(adenine34) deaminase